METSRQNYGYPERPPLHITCRNPTPSTVRKQPRSQIQHEDRGGHEGETELDDTHACGETWDQILAAVDEVLRRVNVNRSRLCEATRGTGLRVLLVVTDFDSTIRIVVMADGTVVRVTDRALLGQEFSPQVTLRGSRPQLAAVARGEFSLTEASSRRLLTTDVNLDVLTSVQEVVRHETFDSVVMDG